MTSRKTKMGELILAMREAYARGENAMAVARSALNQETNDLEATLIAYDLQAGSYVRNALGSPERNKAWCGQLAPYIVADIASGESILEVGVGEATTLAGVLKRGSGVEGPVYGFDVSWSRCAVGRDWLERNAIAAEVFVGDLFSIPLADASIDVVYTSHSIEPNGGRESAALTELLRVTRRKLVLCEPIYELASADAKQRMEHHGYVRGLLSTLEQLGASIAEYRLLPFSPNPLNPSGIIVVEKQNPRNGAVGNIWQCPITGTELVRCNDLFGSPQTGIVYPILRSVPMLRPEHAIVASQCNLELRNSP